MSTGTKVNIVLAVLVLLLANFIIEHPQHNEWDEPPQTILPDTTRHIIDYDWENSKYIYEDDNLIQGKDGAYVSPDDTFKYQTMPDKPIPKTGYDYPERDI